MRLIVFDLGPKPDVPKPLWTLQIYSEENDTSLVWDIVFSFFFVINIL